MDERFDGELTYFYCKGVGVPALADRRRLWETATTGGFRLLPLPGLHARFDREPQFSALAAGLRACLSGHPPPSEDPAHVFERSYRLEDDGREEVIEEKGGARFRVMSGAIHGRVRVCGDCWGGTRLRGWAADGDDRPAAALAMFLDGRYVGYGAGGVPRRSRAKHPEASFKLRLPVTCPAPTSRLRVFALTGDGRASELRQGGKRAGAAPR